MEERALVVRATHAISEYHLVTFGIATLAQLGYCDDRGRLPAVKLLELLTVQQLYAEAQEEKYGRQHPKARA